MTREDWLPRRSAGGSVLAGVLLLAMGAWQIGIGVVIAGGDAFVFTGGGYWYRGDSTGWGWVNVAIGFAAFVIGLGQLGMARRLAHWGTHPVPALVIAAVSAVNQVILAPQYPLWTAVVIAMNVFVVWALATRPRAKESDRLGP